MINEVYLISSLPALSFGKAPPITINEFTTMAHAELTQKNCKVLGEIDLQNIDGNGNGTSSLAGKIYPLLEELQQELAGIRQAKSQGQTAKTDLLPASVLKANPLEREIQIMQCLWETLDDSAQGKTFTMHEVLVYKLKLQLLHRLHSFDTDKGASVLASIVNETENSLKPWAKSK